MYVTASLDSVNAILKHDLLALPLCSVGDPYPQRLVTTEQ